MIKISNLKKSFKNKRVLDIKELNIENKQIFCILGKSGSGKSTFLNIISNLINPDFGTITFEKENPKIEFVFQDFNLIEDLNAFQNIKISLNVNSETIDEKEIIELAKDLELDETLLKKKVKLLSEGERQRVTILRSLVRDFDILLADEPTSNLDEENSHKIFDIFNKISQNKLVIVVSHDIDLVKKYADSYYDLNAKEFKKNEEKTPTPKEEIFNHKISKKRNKFYKLLPAPYLSLIDITKKKYSFFISFIIMLIAILIVPIFMLFSSNNLALKNENTRFSDFDKAFITKQINQSYELNPGEKEKIKQLESINYSLDTYDNYVVKLVINNEKEILKFQTIENDNFFKDRLKYLNIEGNFPENENEFIISEEIAKKYNLKINDKVNVNFGNLQKELTISAINNSLNFENKNLNFFSSKTLSSFIKTNENYFFKGFSLRKTNQITKYNVANENEINIKSYSVINDTDQIIEGQKAKSYEEINLSKEIKEKYDVQLNSFLELNTGYNDFLVKVVGFFESTNPELKTTDSNFKYFASEYQPTFTIFTKPNYDTNLLKEELKEINPYLKLTTNNSQVYKQLAVGNNFIAYLLLLLVIVVSAISFITIILFSKFLTDSKNRVIGILKLLKTKVLNIFLYHSFSYLILSLSVLIFLIPSFFASFYLVINISPGFKLLEINYSYFLSISLLVWLIISVGYYLFYLLISFLTYKKGQLIF
ncbi:ATP-binding cassette domain-containing protein [Mycoplasma sp. Z386]